MSSVELLIVLVILSIVAALALPMIGNPGTAKLRGAAKILMADLNFAQIESVPNSNDLRVVVFDLPSNRYHIAA